VIRHALAAVLAGCLVLGAAARARAQDPAQGQGVDPHAAHRAPSEPSAAPPRELPAFIPSLTDEDRQAAFPEVGGHAAHDRVFHSFVLFDQLEWQGDVGSGGLNVDSSGWFGGDRDRLWFRAEGLGGTGDRDEGTAQVLFGHQFTRWWDVVAGFRQDIGADNPQSWIGFGLQGLAPYWFEVEATAYASIEGQLEAWLEVEYALMVTNRWTLEPRGEAHFRRADPVRHGISSFNTADAGLRLRYQIRRELAPYIGVTWQRAWGAGASASGSRPGPSAVTGVRLWF
jgi:copper resistance protein B